MKAQGSLRYHLTAVLLSVSMSRVLVGHDEDSRRGGVRIPETGNTRQAFGRAEAPERPTQQAPPPWPSVDETAL